MLLLGMFMLLPSVWPQQTYTLSGSITDKNNEPLPGASLVIDVLKTGTTADKQGSYVLADIPEGKYLLSVSFIGFKTLKDTITINGNRQYDVSLAISPLSLHEVVVTDDYAAVRNREESLNIEIVNDDYLKQHMGGSLMGSLERLPGVSAMGIGSGQSKPVIRGLSFNRVVVVENNIKHEAQQWGADHGLEVDQYAVEQVEVIKGPASLRYGSDAIGGVIQLKNRKVPENNSFGGTVDLTGKTNADFLGSSVSLYGRKNRFFGTGRFTLVGYGDFRVPTDSVDIYSFRAPLHKRRLRNTAGNEHNLHLSFGYIKNGFQSRFFVSSINTKSGFFANAHGLEPRRVDTQLHDKSSRDIQFPYQDVVHTKLLNTSTWHLDQTKLALELGFQRNFRQEWSEYVDHGFMPAVFPDTLPFDPNLERQFDKRTYAANFSATLQPHQLWQIEAGLSSEFQDNSIDGRGFLIPAYQQFTAGAFGLVKYQLTGQSTLQAGIRFDYGNIQTQAYFDWFPSPVIANGDTSMQYLRRASALNRNFQNFTWSVGYNLQKESWSFKANAGKGFRMPIAKELAANGVNYHHFSYEVGDPELDPEVSYQLDAGLEYATATFAVGITPFLNYFTNYIYLNPTSEHDRLYGNGNQVFYYTQSRVLRYGAELHAHYKLSEKVQMGLIGETVYARQLSGAKKGFTLPFSPPASAVINLKYQPLWQGVFQDSYAAVDYRLTAAQSDIVPPEETTSGYQLINLNVGGTLQIGRQVLKINFQIQNLLNAKYFNHTSYYRLINVPEPGRNFILNLSMPFSNS